MECINVSGMAEAEMSISKPRLLFVINSDSFFISHRLPIALEAQDQGYEIHVATGITCSNIVRMKEMGFNVHPLALDRRSAGILSNGRTFFNILSIFRKVRPDVVHLVTIKPVLLGGVAARLASVPCVVAAVSGLGIVFVSNGLVANIRRWLVGCCYRMAFNHKNLVVIFQNKDDKKNLIGLSDLPEGSARLIRGSGVELSHYNPSPLPEGRPLVILAARLLLNKGIREFVEAARILKSSGSKACFVLVGEPDKGNPATIKDYELNKWTAEGVIEWWGFRSDIPDVFAASYMVVLPSYYGEGLPKVLLEAAACGRAVVTTDHPGCRDSIQPEVTGILVPPRDAQLLADAIKRLLDNPLLCRGMGRAARELAETAFDVNEVVGKHISIYGELLGRLK